VVKVAAEQFAKDVRLVDFEGDRQRQVFRSRWALISGDPAFFAHPLLAQATPIANRPGFKAWQDDYSSIFAILM